MKDLNKRKIIHYIQRNQGSSRSDISKALFISKPTVSNFVDELLSEGWVSEKESEKGSSSGGRKPYQVFFNQDAYYLVGVDIGGTSIEMAVMNLAGEIINKTAFETQLYVGSQLIAVIADNVTNLIQNSNLENDQIFGVGIGVPGITNVNDGIVMDAPSIGWKNIPLQSHLEELLPFPVYLDNDVNVAALGELWKGVGKTNYNFLMITLGTGIGCGLIINGQLYRGSSYAAGEIGYMVTDKDSAEKKYEHTFTGYGFLDNHVGGPSITRRMLNYLGETEESEWTAKKIFQMANQRDETALEILNEPLSHLSFGLINVISLLNPERIVLGGRISKSMNQFLPYLSTTIEKHIPIQTELETTGVKDVSLLGAGYLLLKEHDSILKM
ncbi:ROK family transcriptional regulator [Virgibacillus salidurans]|uniref:ROK family transcriptional regulator n=1 Tax=Virgibacillus salidurans TaxID=2831673 RepID=UPI0021064A06|nr:ROK family transcriptional regulator [Virgibacillus sp. NKC19-16]